MPKSSIFAISDKIGNQKQEDLNLNANQLKLVFSDGCARLNFAGPKSSPSILQSEYTQAISIAKDAYSEISPLKSSAGGVDFI